jgi:hypothetical protein
MRNEFPPSGRWTGYYYYGEGGSKHRMRMQLCFALSGSIEGEGIDDIAAFLIRGRFDRATSRAAWTKAYIGMHTVQYSGVYCSRAICGDWILMGMRGGFWIWPNGLGEAESAEEQTEIEAPLVLASPAER